MYCWLRYSIMAFSMYEECSILFVCECGVKTFWRCGSNKLPLSESVFTSELPWY